MVINLMSIIRQTHTKVNEKWAYMGNDTKHTCVCGAVVVGFFHFSLSNISIVEWPIQCYRFRGQTHHAYVSSIHMSRFTDPIVCADQQTTNENQSFLLLQQYITEKHYLNATHLLDFVFPRLLCLSFDTSPIILFNKNYMKRNTELNEK